MWDFAKSNPFAFGIVTMMVLITIADIVESIAKIFY